MGKEEVEEEKEVEEETKEEKDERVKGGQRWIKPEIGA